MDKKIYPKSNTKSLKTKRKFSRAMSFRICVYPSRFDKNYLTAHCLELDVFGQDKTLEGAVTELLQIIETQLEVSEETGAQLQFFAPSRVWQIYEQAKKAKRKIPDELMDRIIAQANQRLGYEEPLDVARRVDYIVGTREVIEQCQEALV